jgi:hypothetical protein
LSNGFIINLVFLVHCLMTSNIPSGGGLDNIHVSNGLSTHILFKYRPTNTHRKPLMTI